MAENFSDKFPFPNIMYRELAVSIFWGGFRVDSINPFSEVSRGIEIEHWAEMGRG